MNRGCWLTAICLAWLCGVCGASEWLKPNDLTDSGVWNREEYLAAWRLPAGGANAGGVVRGQLREPPALLGVPLQSASARFVHGTLHSLSLVVLDAGDYFGYQNSNIHGMSAEQAHKAFDEEFARRKTALLSGASGSRGKAHPRTVSSRGSTAPFA